MMFMIRLINLILPIQVLSGVGAIVTAFFRPDIAYAVVSIPLIILVLTWLWGKAVPSPEPISELSEAANALRRKFRAYYVSPIAGRNCSGAASGIMMFLLPITIIACIKGFWWSLAIAAVIIIFTAPLQRVFNPTNFMTLEEEMAHEEILNHLTG